MVHESGINQPGMDTDWGSNYCVDLWKEQVQAGALVEFHSNQYR